MPSARSLQLSDRTGSYTIAAKEARRLQRKAIAVHGQMDKPCDQARNGGVGSMDQRQDRQVSKLGHAAVASCGFQCAGLPVSEVCWLGTVRTVGWLHKC